MGGVSAHIIDHGCCSKQSQPMKESTAPSLSKQWPQGLRVELSPEGLFLKPKPKPRESWPSAFKQRAATDKLKPLRSIQNRFDEKEWAW